MDLDLFHFFESPYPQMETRADRPSGILGVSQYALCTNVAPALRPQTNNNSHFIVLYQN